MTNILNGNQRLNFNDRLLSPSGKFTLIMQGDGNLVLYSVDKNKALWASNTWNTPVTYAIMQNDGNFVCYDPFGKAYWASNTSGVGAYVTLEDSGQLVIIDMSGVALWGSNDRLMANQQLNVNDRLLSPNGKFTLIMQGDGNLVLYSADANKAIWASNTWNTPTRVTHAIMQTDGNFVCYDDAGKAYWASNTWGFHPGAFVVLQGDGNLVIFDGFGNGLWASDLCIPHVPWQNYPKKLAPFDSHIHVLPGNDR